MSGRGEEGNRGRRDEGKKGGGGKGRGEEVKKERRG